MTDSFQILGIIQTVLALSCISNGAAMHSWDIRPSVHLGYTLKVRSRVCLDPSPLTTSRATMPSRFFTLLSSLPSKSQSSSYISAFLRLRVSAFSSYATCYCAPLGEWLLRQPTCFSVCQSPKHGTLGCQASVSTNFSFLKAWSFSTS